MDLEWFQNFWKNEFSDGPSIQKLSIRWPWWFQPPYTRLLNHCWTMRSHCRGSCRYRQENLDTENLGFLFLYSNITNDYERSKSERYKWFYESMILWTNAVRTSFLNEINALRFTAPSGWEKVTLKEVMWPDS